MKFTITLILILFALILILGLIVYILIKSLKAKKKELAEMQARLESARANTEQLSNYIDNILKIKADEKSVSQKIKEAESDEEIFNIIADIVDANNNRMQDHKN